MNACAEIANGANLSTSLNEPGDSKPELLLGLKYDALIGNLYVTISRCANLYDKIASDKNPSKQKKNSNYLVHALLNVF